MKRGEIWWASLPDPTGSEPGYRRPVLIVQTNEFNRSAIRTVIVAAITSNRTLAAAPGNVELSTHGTGLMVKSVVNVSQVVTLDKGFLTERSGRASSSAMRRIEDGLRLVLAL